MRFTGLSAPHGRIYQPVNAKASVAPKRIANQASRQRCEDFRDVGVGALRRLSSVKSASMVSAEVTRFLPRRFAA
jgi:hypothetical protein